MSPHDPDPAAPPARTRGEALFARARRVIPGGIYGHQSPRQLVRGAHPLFFVRGEGSRVWDADGNEYVDYMCSYGPIVLGHRHPRVEEAARAQAAAGDCFNGPAPVFVELAEHLVATTPFADWAVFAKNGSDVCTWAVQVARAATGRSGVVKARGAYHGTHAWCSPLPAGVTPEDRAHVREVPWNDLAALEALVDADTDVAAIMLTPFRHDAFADSELPAEGYLAGVRRLCDARGIVFVLDDVRAGFRLHLGGSGEYFGVRPDLACYCKALANGHALAACVGRDAFRDAARAVFFTGSYFTAAVPMAAALACLRELADTDAVARMMAYGQRLAAGLAGAARAHGLEIVLSGPPTLPFMSFRGDPEQRLNRVFCGAAAEHGVYLHPHHNWFVSAAHDDRDLARTLEAADRAFARVAAAA